MSMVESNVKLVEDFSRGVGSCSSCLSSCTTAGTGDRGLGLLGYLGGGSGCHTGWGCLSWKRHFENSGVDWRKALLKRTSCM